MMRMITIESDSYHHWPAAPSTPHPTPFPLMSIHSNQRVGMITLTVAMVLMMLVTVVINTIIINSRLSLSDLVFTADIKVRIFCSTFLICIYSPYCFFCDFVFDYVLHRGCHQGNWINALAEHYWSPTLHNQPSCVLNVFSRSHIFCIQCTPSMFLLI